MAVRSEPLCSSFCFSAMAVAVLPSVAEQLAGPRSHLPRPAAKEEPHRSPIALALSPDGTRLLVANQTAGSVSLVDTHTGKVLHELADRRQARRRGHLARRHAGVVTHWFGYDLALLTIKNDRITVAGRVEVGPEPRGVVIAARRQDGLRGRRRGQRGGQESTWRRAHVTGPRDRRSRAARARAVAGRFALAGGQRPIAERFAGHRRDRWEFFRTIPDRRR